jgi:type VI secretion system protein ImpM
MPAPLAGAPSWREAAAGCHGKIPSRGDFIRCGLSRAFLDAWDAWLQRMLAASRSALGEDWLPAWLEAPIWRFALAPGLAGADAAIGLFMPSVDRVGRYFPLTLAATLCGAAPADLIRAGGGFLDAVERLGREAVAEDLPPEVLAARVAAALAEAPSEAGVAPELAPRAGALWWTAGAPRRPPGAFATDGLPQPALFAAMLDARLEAQA